MSRRLKVPAALPVVTTATRVLLPGGIIHVNMAHDDPNARLVEKLFWTHSFDNPHTIAVMPVDRRGKANEIGTAGRVLKITKFQKANVSSHVVLLEGLCRVRVVGTIQEGAMTPCDVTQLDMEPGPEAPETEELTALVKEFRATAFSLIAALEGRIPIIANLKGILESTPVALLADVCISAIGVDVADSIAVLNAVDLTERYTIALKILTRQLVTVSAALQVVNQSGKARARVRKGPARPHVSSHTDSRADDPVGQDDSGGDDEEEPTSYATLRRRVEEAGLPAEAKRAAVRELRRIQGMERSQHLGPEHHKVVNYLEWLLSLPWGRQAQAARMPDVALARKTLDDDHHGLDKIKQRIIEYIAVRWINPAARGSILCLVGPPGVGKTSLGRSIATTLGRDFHRISLGGVRDEADIRGFNRTYIGSQPGRIIQGMRHVTTSDPVILLDEIDKVAVGNSAHGDPSSALLEVLDPAQNHTFHDHYLGVPYDLSRVMFIATANSVDTIPAPLLDRMEVIEVPGYTFDEKLHISRRHLLPRQLAEHGLTAQDLEVPDETLMALCRGYTHEPGVRGLERKLAAICRAVVVKVLARKRDATEALDAKRVRAVKLVLAPDMLEDILGPPIFERDEDPAARVTIPGIAIGLSAGAGGGRIMFVEASRMPGRGAVRLTGSLGAVIKESAHIALGWVKSRGIGAGVLDQAQLAPLSNSDIHIHFPEGAVGKDGPSGGAALATAIVSLLSGRRARSDTAVTGELTLAGAILPVGGIKAKVLAAYQAGIRRVVLPQLNHARDLTEIPPDVRAALEFVPVRAVEEVLHNTLAGAASPAGAALAKL
eukprot:m.74901 g.74901  ORF g.74901 m.74901 type:complete len:831 (+) comp7786_c0_seq1:1208-3700(+)